MARMLFRALTALNAPQRGSLQLGVFRLSLLQDGNVRIGVLPEGEKIIVSGECADAGCIGIGSLRGLRLQHVCASHSQMRQCSRPAVPDDAAVIENLLKLGGDSAALSGGQSPNRAELPSPPAF